MGSPATARSQRFDSTRISDLQNIQWQVINFYQAKGSIPESLEILKDPLSGSYIPNDPETKQPYVLTKTGPASFKLCATFALAMSDKDQAIQKGESVAYPAYPGGVDQNWQHTAGNYCFERTIDKDLFPIRKGL
jgi:hypothetical protein